MALGIYFAPTGMTQAQYSDCIARLNKAGAAHPAGRRYHAMFGDGGNLHVFDVWESQAQFDKFGETLLPILQSIGIDPGQPMVAQIHNVIVPPAKAAAKKAKAKPARKAAPKRKAAKATKKKRK